MSNEYIRKHLKLHENTHIGIKCLQITYDKNINLLYTVE